ncbi:MAG: tandem-95 repeat protein, partial [Lentisphaerae bacterium]|nr:tandem-95 repeat protein [Lentisphaerota bacterium]
MTTCTDILTNFADPITSVTICGQGDNGTVVSGPTLPCVTYTPEDEFNGNDTVCVISCNGLGLCDTTIIVYTVTPVNDPPVAVDDAESTTEDTPVTVDVIVNDSDIDGPLDSTSVVTTTAPSNGATVDNGDGTISYTPELDFVGVDTFEYAVCDTGMPVLCDTAIVVVTVNPTPDTSYVTTPEETPVTTCTDILTNFADPITSVTICGQGDNGTVVSGPTLPCVTYT